MYACLAHLPEAAFDPEAFPHILQFLLNGLSASVPNIVEMSAENLRDVFSACTPTGSHSTDVSFQGTVALKQLLSGFAPVLFRLCMKRLLGIGEMTPFNADIFPMVAKLISYSVMLSSFDVVRQMLEMILVEMEAMEPKVNITVRTKFLSSLERYEK
jgi:hypothetical protein